MLLLLRWCHLRLASQLVCLQQQQQLLLSWQGCVVLGWEASKTQSLQLQGAQTGTGPVQQRKLLLLQYCL
jgi:hypothetical protein